MWMPSEALELLDDLSELGFPDQQFRRIHSHGHSMAKYRDYCKKLRKRFTSDSSSQLLCERMYLIVTCARTSPVPPISAAIWPSIVDEIVKQAGNGRRGYRRLSEQHQLFLAEQIAKLVETASDHCHPMRWVAAWQLRNTLWRWTVDGVSSNGTVVVDAAKSDVTIWPITQRAQAAVTDRIHEHVVPRVVITRHLIEQRMIDIDEIATALRRYCLAAVATKADEEELRHYRLHQSMPKGWRWGDDPWARYRVANLYDKLVWPDGWSRYE